MRAQKRAAVLFPEKEPPKDRKRHVSKESDRFEENRRHGPLPDAGNDWTNERLNRLMNLFLSDMPVVDLMAAVGRSTDGVGTTIKTLCIGYKHLRGVYSLLPGRPDRRGKPFTDRDYYVIVHVCSEGAKHYGVFLDYNWVAELLARDPKEIEDEVNRLVYNQWIHWCRQGVLVNPPEPATPDDKAYWLRKALKGKTAKLRNSVRARK